MIKFIYSFIIKVLVYLSCTALAANHQRLVDWLQMAPNIPVGFLCHNKDMWFELL